VIHGKCSTTLKERNNTTFVHILMTIISNFLQPIRRQISHVAKIVHLVSIMNR
jgi:hypothetical protein